jgi:pyridoxamine 5'-phosphate oxidase
MKKEISALRENYTLSKLGRADLSTDPMDQFRKWFDDALSAEILEPNAMVLATLNKDNYPSSRVVLIKEIENDGIIFYTNYKSQKAQDIENNPKVSVTFLWKEIQRQVRIEGIATKVSREQSAAYFNKRPRASQIGAWTSVQSSIIDSREELEKRKAEIEEKYKDSETIPLPLDWGGYKITATAYEFWQGRRSRLHDRFRYEKGGDESWEIFRLSP